MSSSHHERVKEVFLEAMELAPGERVAFVRKNCGRDPTLRDEVEAMLAANEDVDGQFLAPVEQRLAEGFLDSVQQNGDGENIELGLKPGDTVGPYQIVELKGEGGFGDVFLAHQEQPIRRDVALKIVKLGMDTRQVVSRFKVEQQALAMMDHPNIARVYDAGATEQGRPFFVMEYVDGHPITQYSNQERLGIDDRLRLFLDVCNAVQHAHLKGIIHRDIKPSNVLVTEIDGHPTPKVIDFGIAKAMDQQLTDKSISTRVEQLLGTPGYMSPEQAALSPHDIDTRTDVYSLGVLLYELLVGAMPFDTTRMRELGIEGVRRTICDKDPMTPSSRLTTISNVLPIVEARKTTFPSLRRRIRGDLDWIVMRAMEKDRTRRYLTTAELAADVRRHLEHEPVIAGPAGITYRAQKFVRKYRSALRGVALIVLALTLGVVAGSWLYFEAIDASWARRVDSYTSSGILAAARGDPAGGVLWFSNAARMSPPDSERERANRTRIGTWARQCPTPISAFVHGAEMLKKTAFHPEENYLMALGARGEVTIWDIERDAEVGFVQVADGVSAAEWSPDGAWLAFATADGRVDIRHFPLGERVDEIPTSQPIHALAFSPDGRRLAIAGNEVLVWDCEDRRLLDARFPHPDAVLTLVFSSDGDHLATASRDGKARLFDLSKASPDPEPVLGPVENVTPRGLSTPFRPLFVDNDRGLLTLENEKELSWWSVASGEPRKDPQLRSPEPIRTVVASPYGRYFVVCGSSAHLWDASSGTAISSRMLHRNAIAAAAFSPGETSW